jgi:hypothetical protein
MTTVKQKHRATPAHAGVHDQNWTPTFVGVAPSDA